MRCVLIGCRPHIDFLSLSPLAISSPSPRAALTVLHWSSISSIFTPRDPRTTKTNRSVTQRRGDERDWGRGAGGGAKRKWKRDRWRRGDEGRERDRAGNRGREGGVIIYQVFGCAWQRRKLISTLCVHQLHSQASQGIPLACVCVCEAAGDTHTHFYYTYSF